MNRILITGITGMVGSHLAEYILENHPESEVHGMVRWRSPLDNVNAIRDRIILHIGDLTDFGSLLHVLQESNPTWIFHLAAQSFVPSSFIHPNQTIQTNAIGTLNLLEAVRSYEEAYGKVGRIRVHVCSSSEVYGQVQKDELPIDESQPFRPASPYGVSKVSADMIGWQYWRSHGLNVVRTRMFTHTGPRRGPVFAEGSFARQIACAEVSNQQEKIHVGYLDSLRTWADVRDAVRAYWLLLEKCEPGEVYNIGGNFTCTVGQMLETLKGMSTLKNVSHVVEKSLMRYSDVTQQVPNVERFKKATGWEPTIPFEKTMMDLLNYYRMKRHEHFAR